MTLPDEMLNIDTPENVAFGYNVAGIGSRFLAALVDTTVIVLLQLLAIGASAFALSEAKLMSSLGAWASAIFGLVAFLFFWGYYIFFEMLWNGQSPGKRWAGLRVIRTDGTPVTLAESIIRNLVRLIDFMPIGYGIGIVTMFSNDQARRLGDLAAGSLVVHDGGEISVQSIAAHGHIAIPADLPPLDPGLPLERLQQQDIQIMEDFLARRSQLANASFLAIQILKRLYLRMGLEPPQDLTRPDGQLLALLVGIRSRSHSNGNNHTGGSIQ
ncbi:MAG: RDD family protein [Anaerolineales bacterium]